MKQKIEKATGKAFGAVIAIAAIPFAVIFVALWFALGVGGKIVSLFIKTDRQR